MFSIVIDFARFCNHTLKCFHLINELIRHWFNKNSKQSPTAKCNCVNNKNVCKLNNHFYSNRPHKLKLREQIYYNYTNVLTHSQAQLRQWHTHHTAYVLFTLKQIVWKRFVSRNWRTLFLAILHKLFLSWGS